MVDDIPETRENLRKLLAFESDIEVVGAAATGREGIEMARETQPDVILMDINMPDMDGIAATEIINKEIPVSAVVIMSVQEDAAYLRRAMQAGARDFLFKPISGDDLYATIRKAYDLHRATRERFQRAAQAAPEATAKKAERLGKIIVVYSPQGGAGCTTVATNIAFALMREDTRVLLVDADLQFGDVEVFLNLKAQTTIIDLLDTVDDLDEELVESILATHDSGLRVLLAPHHPADADKIKNREDMGKLVEKLAMMYDFVVVDTQTYIDDGLISLFDVADRIVLVANPTLPSIKNARLAFDVMDALEYPPEKVVFVLNRMQSERERGRISAEAIENNLKRKVEGQILLDEKTVISAVNRGVPVIASNRNRSPAKDFIELAAHLRSILSEREEEEELEEPEQVSRKSRGLRLFGG